MPSLLLYGGTFNPIHLGHLALCRTAWEQLALDRILLMPAARPPHKEAPDLAADRHRLAMCRLAARLLPRAEACAYELERGGASYTIDTLEYLHHTRPGCDLYLLMGSDMYLTFRQWRRWRDIAALATLAVGVRRGEDSAAVLSAREELDALGVRTVLLDHPALEMSSTGIREELRRTGHSDRLPPEVMIYLRYQGLYGTGSPGGVVDEPLQRLLRDYIRPLMGEKRYSHSLCVEQRAVHLAKLYGADPKKAAVAGVLHDICKDMDPADRLQTIPRSDIINAIDFSAQPQLIHSYAAPPYIREHLGIDDPEILDAVRYHTSARGEMTPLDCTVYLADFTSDDRDYPDVEVLRALCETSMDGAMAYALRYIVEQELPAAGQTPCPATRAAYARFCK